MKLYRYLSKLDDNVSGIDGLNCLNLCSCLRRKRLMKCITRQTSEAFILLWSQCEEGICWASLRLYISLWYMSCVVLQTYACVLRKKI